MSLLFLDVELRDMPKLLFRLLRDRDFAVEDDSQVFNTGGPRDTDFFIFFFVVKEMACVFLGFTVNFQLSK